MRPLPLWQDLWLQYAHRMYYWRFWRDLVWAVVFGLLLAATSFRVTADENLHAKVLRLEAQVRMAEANLLGCLNGGYTGLYHFTRRNETVHIVCDAPAFTIVDQPS